MVAPLTQVLILLASSVLLLTLARRVGAPTTLAYLAVGVILGVGAVRLVRQTGKPVAAIARDLGVNEGTLGNWVVKDKAAREGRGSVPRGCGGAETAARGECGAEDGT